MVKTADFKYRAFLVFPDNLPICGLKQEVTLRQGQDISGFASNQHAIHANLIGFRIDFNIGSSTIVNHILLADLSAVGYRRNHLSES